MELPRLVHPRLMWTRVLALLAVGAGLAVVHPRLPWAPDRQPLVLVLAQGESVEEAVLIDQAVRAGWLRTDPAIRRILSWNMRLAGSTGSDEERVEEALALGMGRTDPMVRQRLIYRAQDMLGQVREPTFEEQLAWLQAHPEDFRIPDQVFFEQRFLGQDGQEEQALPAVDTLQQGSLWSMNARFGAGFAEGLEGVQVGDKVVLESTYGWHRVHMLQRERGPIPDVSQVVGPVSAAWTDARRREVRAQRLAQLVAAYEIRQ